MNTTARIKDAAKSPIPGMILIEVQKSTNVEIKHPKLIKTPKEFGLNIFERFPPAFEIKVKMTSRQNPIAAVKIKGVMKSVDSWFFGLNSCSISSFDHHYFLLIHPKPYCPTLK